MSGVSAQRASAPRFLLRFCHILAVKFSLKDLVDRVCNVMAHAQKPDFVFRRNGRVHLNSWGRQFSRLLAAEVCASAVVMLDTPNSEVVKGTGYPLHSPVSPSLPLPCVTVCHHVSTGLYPLYRRLGGPQGRSGRVRKISSTRIHSRDSKARSESQYRLSYPGPTSFQYAA